MNPVAHQMTYEDRPWLALYRNDVPPDIDVEHPTMLEMFGSGGPL